MKRILPLIVIVLSVVACDLEKEIDIDLAQSEPVLVLNAMGDTEDQKLYLELRQSQPIVGATVDQTNVGNVNMKLYKGNKLEMEATPGNSNAFDLHVEPGSTYSLELTSKHHPTARALVTVPELPQFISAKLDTNEVIWKKNAQLFYQGKSSGDAGEYFYPLSVELADPPGEKNYYLLEVYFQSPKVNNGDRMSLVLGTSDRVLIQDNPDVEAAGALSDADVGAFFFSQMIVSDVSFSGTRKTLNLLFPKIPIDQYLSYNHEENEPYIYATIEVKVRHVTEIAFRYYRSAIMQGGGVGFFTEPVSIVSNVERGYGCFSLTSSVTQVALKLKIENRYYRPDYND